MIRADELRGLRSPELGRDVLEEKGSVSGAGFDFEGGREGDVLALVVDEEPRGGRDGGGW